jgi:hypothetical protein
MYLALAKRFLFETDKRSLWKLEGDSLRSEAQTAAQEGRGVSAISLRVDHQQLQPALPRLLGGRGRQARNHSAASLS